MGDRLILTVFFLLAAIVPAGAENGAISPEVPHASELSNRDINRIVCPGRINDLIFSEEKGLTGHFSENNAFIKFKIEQLGSEKRYASAESELFVVCDGMVYTLIVTPKDMPSATIRLAQAHDRQMVATIEAFKELPLEKRVLQLLREAYAQNYPPGYRVAKMANPIHISPELDLQLTTQVGVDGIGLQLKEFVATSLGDRQTRIEEKLFLKPQIGTALLAVAVLDHQLQPGESTRVLVIEQKESPQ